MKIWESTWNWIGSPYMWLRAWIQWHAALRAGKRVLRLYAGQIRTLTQNEEYDFVWLHNATLEISGWQFIWHDVLFITGMACIRSDAGIPRISQEPEVHSGSGDPPNQGQAGDVEASGGPGCARPPEPITRIDIYPSSFVSRGEANGGAGGSGGIVRLETGHSEMILYDSACKAAYLAALSQWLDCPIGDRPVNQCPAVRSICGGEESQ